MQAREQLHESKPVRPGLVERIEFEYRRHGTLCLIANFDVATGKLISPSIGPTRTEEDFAANSKNKAPIEGLSEVLVGRWSRRAVAVSGKEGMGVERGVQSRGVRADRWVV